MTVLTHSKKSFIPRMVLVAALFSGISAEGAAPTETRNISAATTRIVLVERDGSVWLRDAGTLPVRVPLPGKIASVCSGAAHFLALAQDGKVWAWGDNSAGQLGIGNTAPHRAPVRVELAGGIAQIACGAFHSLARAVDGRVWAWGSNTLGQIGNGRSGAFEIASTPEESQHMLNIIAIAAGSGYSLALHWDGDLWMWGNGTAALPERIQPLRNIIAIRVNANRALALGENGRAWTWTSTPNQKPEISSAPAGSSLLADSESNPVDDALSKILVIDGTASLDGKPLAHVNVLADGTTCGESDENGRYSCFMPLGWNGKLLAALHGYRFMPLKLQNDPSGEKTQDFLAKPAGIEISGQTTPDTSIAGTGAKCVNVNGLFTCSVPEHWSGTLTATRHGARVHYARKHFRTLTSNLSGLRFMPHAETRAAAHAHMAPPRRVPVRKAPVEQPVMPVARASEPVRPVAAAPTTAAPAVVRIHGMLTEGSLGGAGKAVADASLDGANCTRSDAAGDYVCTVPSNWSGRIVPHKHNFHFYPTSRSYDKLRQDTNNQDFNAAYEPN